MPDLDTVPEQDEDLFAESKAGSKVKVDYSKLVRAEQDPGMNYAKMPHEGYMIFLITGGEMLKICQAFQKRADKIRHDATRFTLDLRKFFGPGWHLKRIGHGNKGRIDVDIDLDVGPRLTRKKGENHEQYIRRRDKQRGDGIRAARERIKSDKKFAGWVIDSDFCSGMGPKGVGGAKREYLAITLRVNRNTPEGKAWHEKMVRALEQPDADDLGRELAAGSPLSTFRIRGGRRIYFPVAFTWKKHWFIKIPIDGDNDEDTESKVPQAKECFFKHGTCRRLTMSQFWRILEGEKP